MSGGPAPRREPLLRVADLRVSFPTERGPLRAVDGVSFEVGAGEMVAIVGESGCGKSVTAQTIVGLTRAADARVEGSARFAGEELISATDADLRRLRGDRVAIVFQDSASSFNPVRTIGAQIVEAIRAHTDSTRTQARERAVELLAAVGLQQPRRQARAYPHELSGGMRQRAMIAMALALEPELLIADEPTTALDVTVQAQILTLLRDLNRERGLATVLITHDLGVVAETADRVLVMYAGRIVEEGSVGEVFDDPGHPYTWGLLGSLTRLDLPRPRRLPQIAGSPPSPLAPPGGCPFGPRCPHRFASCAELPALEPRLGGGEAVGLSGGGQHRDRCWLEAAEKRARRRVGGGIGLESR